MTGGVSGTCTRSMWLRRKQNTPRFRQILAEEGVEVVAAGPDPDGELDAIFAYDPTFMTDGGAILTRMGKPARLAEADYAAQTYAELGIPILARIEEPGTFDGGDAFWLDEQDARRRTLLPDERCGNNSAPVDPRWNRGRGRTRRLAALAWTGRMPPPHVDDQPGAGQIWPWSTCRCCQFRSWNC